MEETRPEDAEESACDNQLCVDLKILDASASTIEELALRVTVENRTSGAVVVSEDTFYEPRSLEPMPRTDPQTQLIIQVKDEAGEVLEPRVPSMYHAPMGGPSPESFHLLPPGGFYGFHSRLEYFDFAFDPGMSYSVTVLLDFAVANWYEEKTGVEDRRANPTVLWLSQYQEGLARGTVASNTVVLKVPDGNKRGTSRK